VRVSSYYKGKFSVAPLPVQGFDFKYAMLYGSNDIPGDEINLQTCTANYKIAFAFRYANYGECSSVG